MRQHPVRRRVMSIVGSAVLGGVTATELWLVGLSVPFAAAFGVVAAALSVAWSGLADADAQPVLRADPPARHGKRSDIVQVSWSLRPVRIGVGRVAPRLRPVHEAGVRRLRRFAARRLGTYGLDLGSPGDRAQVERMLGADVAAVLTSPGYDVPLATVNACLDALEALDPDRKGPPADDR